jgi:hypothetical protein
MLRGTTSFRPGGVGRDALDGPGAFRRGRRTACALSGAPAPFYWSREVRGTFFGGFPGDVRRRRLRGLSADGHSFSFSVRRLLLPGVVQ